MLFEFWHHYCWQSERYWFWWHFHFVTNSCTFHSNIIWGWKSQILVTKLFFRILWIISKICVFPSTIYVLWKLLILVTNVVTRLDIFGTVTRSVTNVCNFYSNILKGVSYWYLLQLFINLKLWNNLKWNWHILVTYFYICIL